MKQVVPKLARLTLARGILVDLLRSIAGAVLSVVLISCLPVASSARARSAWTDSRAEAEQQSEIGAFLRYDFNGDWSGKGLTPGITLNRQVTFWEDAQGASRLLRHYGADLSA